MKLTNRSQLESLSGFQMPNFLATSFYLDTDKARQSRKEIAVSAKNLITGARTDLETMDMSREKRESLLKDLEKINAFCAQSLGSYNSPGLAVFSCSRHDFWQVFDLPHGPRNRLIFDQNFYIRPLHAVMDKFRPTCALLINRREAKWYSIYMGEIALLDAITSDVPGQVKKGGFEGTQSKRIERHIDAHLHDHFKKAAQITFDQFKKGGFDWLFVGCENSSFSALDPLLHPYLKERLKAKLKSKPGDSPKTILGECLETEERLKKADEEDVVQRLVSELERGGLACSGAKETLRRLNSFEIQTLVVTHNFSMEGRICPSCKFLYLDESTCPVCQRKTDAVMDVIDEAIESAISKNCQVRHITPPSRLDRYGKIGAFLKYKL